MKPIVHRNWTTYQTPGRIASVQIDDCAQIVIQDDVDVESASDTVNVLEEVSVMLAPVLTVFQSGTSLRHI